MRERERELHCFSNCLNCRQCVEEGGGEEERERGYSFSVCGIALSAAIQNYSDNIGMFSWL